MTPELTMLAISVILGLIHMLATGQASNIQHGVPYGLGPRDEKKPLTGIPGRVARSYANFMQTFPFFAAAVLAAHVAGRHSWLTVWGTQLYVYARVIYVPLYLAAVPVIRSIAFTIATAGIVMVLVALA